MFFNKKPTRFIEYTYVDVVEMLDPTEGDEGITF